MKIKISKSQWEKMGKKAGWVGEEKNNPKRKYLGETSDLLDKCEELLNLAGEDKFSTMARDLNIEIISRLEYLP